MNTLLSFRHSTCSWRVRAALHYFSIPHQVVDVDIVRKLQNDSKWFQMINSQHQVPVLLLGDVKQDIEKLMQLQENIRTDMSKNMPKDLHTGTSKDTNIDTPNNIDNIDIVEELQYRIGRVPRLSQSLAIIHFLQEKSADPSKRLLPTEQDGYSKDVLPFVRSIIYEFLEVVNSSMQPMQNIRTTRKLRNLIQNYNLSSTNPSSIAATHTPSTGPNPNPSHTLCHTSSHSSLKGASQVSSMSLNEYISSEWTQFYLNQGLMKLECMIEEYNNLETFTSLFPEQRRDFKTDLTESNPVTIPLKQKRTWNNNSTNSSRITSNHIYSNTSNHSNAPKFSIGHTFTMADIFLYPQLYAIVERTNIDISQYPNLEQLYHQLGKLPCFKETQP